MLKHLTKLKHLAKFPALSIAMTATVATYASAFSQNSLSPDLSSQLHPLGEVKIAQAMINGTSEYPEIKGRILLLETDQGLQIIGNLFNVPPGNHGFHIHEFGSCAEDGTAAGGHYNPDGVKHGNLLVDGFENAHAGDLGNISVSSDGVARWEQTFPGLSLSGGHYPVSGRALMLHAESDDFSQPTGNAGARLGCGTIQLLPSEYGDLI